MRHITHGHSRWFGAVVVPLLLLTAACGGGETAAPTETPSPTSIAENATDGDSANAAASEATPICELFSEEEVADVIGLEVASTENRGSDHCQWHFDETGEQYLNITVSRDVMYNAHVEYFDGAKYDVDGLGDAAKFAFHGPEANTDISKMYVLQGDAAIEILLAGSTLDEAATREAFTDFGSEVLASR